MQATISLYIPTILLNVSVYHDDTTYTLSLITGPTIHPIESTALNITNRSQMPQRVISVFKFAMDRAEEIRMACLDNVGYLLHETVARVENILQYVGAETFDISHDTHSIVSAQIHLGSLLGQLTYKVADVSTLAKVALEVCEERTTGFVCQWLLSLDPIGNTIRLRWRNYCNPCTGEFSDVKTIRTVYEGTQLLQEYRTEMDIVRVIIERFCVRVFRLLTQSVFDFAQSLRLC